MITVKVNLFCLLQGIIKLALFTLSHLDQVASDYTLKKKNPSSHRTISKLKLRLHAGNPWTTNQLLMNLGTTQSSSQSLYKRGRKRPIVHLATEQLRNEQHVGLSTGNSCAWLPRAWTWTVIHSIKINSLWHQTLWLALKIRLNKTGSMFAFKLPVYHWVKCIKSK